MRKWVGTARAGTRWDETQGWDPEDGGEADGGEADGVCGWCDSQDTSSPLFLQSLMFARCRLHHCYPPGFPSTLQPSHRVWPCLHSQSNHTVQKAFLMKHISSKQPRSPHFFLLPSFFPLGSYKDMPSSTERGSQPPCPSYLPTLPYPHLLSLEDCKNCEGNRRNIFIFAFLHCIPRPRGMSGIPAQKRKQ